MKNLLFTIKYLGIGYHGWQVQSNARSVQSTVQDAIESIIGKRESINGCSRTDAGVHANMFCFNMRTQTSLPCETLVRALNAKLPDDISAVSCREVPMDFHARYDCTGKEYLYIIHNSSAKDPFSVGRCLEWKYPLDAEFLSQQAKSFIGTHDFSAFCAAGSSVDEKTRTIFNFDVLRENDNVLLTVSGNGFLYNMVRIMVGTLLDISSGKLERDSIASIIDSKQRDRAGFTAAPQGLYLNKVVYGGLESGQQ